MSNQRTPERDEAERLWDAQSWFRTSTLTSLIELNEQCLELLAEQAAAGPASALHPMLRDVGALLRSLDARSRQRAASCPYLLLDAGFADQQRWAWASGSEVRDEEPRFVQPFFTVPSATSVARLVLTFAWHLCRSQNSAARMLLGMSAHSTGLIASCSLRQITDLAEAHPEWLQPRWMNRLQMWRELLINAIAGEGPALDQARMRGLRLLAAEVRCIVPR